MTGDSPKVQGKYLLIIDMARLTTALILSTKQAKQAAAAEGAPMSVESGEGKPLLSRTPARTTV